ncbi:conserved hypothetical protein [Neospora caninum Liverpool]|uniref:Conserved oligomeric Golgi complex subunit 2 n=1 Tax=Neospora caninum (strain Liverpool) TaxID=572307 RepID=F0VIR0_NEOCL|nr:conserved hypothetical protein [Neospora caninum Liverpool]CBZ53621.1 conserved hypothetical protein [Neospora caninum Liverpool]CEL67612.1 TPA: Conserved oligomeric Golgi complex subunit 2 [Neospora caninum Liverpool]|eukprot:XP_003883653.1 conserved hypothetical protein [Neospora caninum Liverpool]
MARINEVEPAPFSGVERGPQEKKQTLAFPEETHDSERPGVQGSSGRTENGAETRSTNKATPANGLPLTDQPHAANPLAYVLERRKHCSLQALHSSLASSCSSLQEQLLTYLQTNYAEISSIASELEDADGELRPLLTPLSEYKLRAQTLFAQLNAQRASLQFLLQQKQRALSRRRHLRLVSQAYRSFRVTAADLRSLLGSSSCPNGGFSKALHSGGTAESPSASDALPALAASETRARAASRDAGKEETAEAGKRREIAAARGRFFDSVERLRQTLEEAPSLSSGDTHGEGEAAAGDLALAASERARVATQAAQAAQASGEEGANSFFDGDACLSAWRREQPLPLLPMRDGLLRRFVGLETAARELKRLEECLLGALPFFNETRKDSPSQDSAASPEGLSCPGEGETWICLEAVESRMRHLLRSAESPAPSSSADAPLASLPSGGRGPSEALEPAALGSEDFCDPPEAPGERSDSAEGDAGPSFALPVGLADLARAVQRLRTAMHARLLRELRDLLRSLCLSAIEARKLLSKSEEACGSPRGVSFPPGGSGNATGSGAQAEDARSARVAALLHGQSHIEEEWCLALEHLVRPLLEGTGVDSTTAAREQVEDLFRQFFVDALVADALAASQQLRGPSGDRRPVADAAPGRREAQAYRAFLRALAATLVAPPDVFLWLAGRLTHRRHAQRPCAALVDSAFPPRVRSGPPATKAPKAQLEARRKGDDLAPYCGENARETACCCCCETREPEEAGEASESEETNGDRAKDQEADATRTKPDKLWLLSDVLAVHVLQAIETTFSRLFKPAFKDVCLSVYVDTLDFFSSLEALMAPCERARFQRLPAVKAFSARRSSLLLWATIFEGQHLELLQSQLREDQRADEKRKAGDADPRGGLAGYKKIPYRDQVFWFPSTVLLLRLLRCRFNVDRPPACQSPPALADDGSRLSSGPSALPSGACAGSPASPEDASALQFASLVDMQRASRLFASQFLPQSLAFFVASLSAFARGLPSIARGDGSATPGQQTTHSGLSAGSATPEGLEVSRGGSAPSSAVWTRALLLIADVLALWQSIRPSPEPPTLVLACSESSLSSSASSSVGPAPVSPRRVRLDFPPLPETQEAPANLELRLGPVFQAALWEVHRGVEASLPVGQCCLCVRAEEATASRLVACPRRKEEERGKIEEGNALMATLWDIFQCGVDTLSTARARLEQQILSHVQMICKGSLLPLRSIPAAYRMTQKQAPRSASPYVDRVLQPLLLFRASVDAVVPGDVGRSILRRVAVTVSSLWAEEVEQLLHTEEQKESALQRLQRSSASAHKSAGSGSLTDFQKMKLQLFLDGQTLGETLLQRVAEEPSGSRLLRPHFALLDKLGDSSQKTHDAVVSEQRG